VRLPGPASSLYARSVRVPSAVILLLLSVGCAASGACDVDGECDTLMYCRDGTCRRDCTTDLSCGPGRICTSRGECVSGVRPDAGPDAPPASDAGPDAPSIGLDAPRQDAPALDAPALDASALDAPTLDAPAPDVPVGFDAGLDAGADVLRDAGPVVPGPGAYAYMRAAVGGLNDTVAVAFHPDGSYALVLERSDEVHLYDWASGTATRFDVRVAGRSVTLDDLLFSADGSTAWIVGYERISATDSGVVIAFSDAAYRRGDGVASFRRLAVSLGGERPSGIERPRAASGGPGGGHPVLLTQSGTSPYVARLRELDPVAETFGGLFVARPTGAGCDDLAFVDNEFGGWGLVLACGTNGAEILYYTEIGGVGEWRLGTGGYGNVSRLDAPPSGDYALIANWSSDRLHRHEGGALASTSASPSIASGIFDVSFSADGRFALVTGRALGTMLRGTVFEFRSDLYRRTDITDVSIEGFALPPYSATSSTSLTDSAWRPGCDGGLLVGGQLSPTSVGMIVEFQRAGGVSCR
jgi:hypothetical protein